MRALPRIKRAATSHVTPGARLRVASAAALDAARAVLAFPRSSRRQTVQPDHVATSFQCQSRAEGEPVSPRDAIRAKEMRRIASARLGYWGLDALMEPAELVVSELITNALQHGHGGTVDFSLSYADDTVRISVSDTSPRRPRKRCADPDSEGGRGLALVEWTAAEHGGAWGTTSDGRTTWCTLPAPSARQPANHPARSSGARQGQPDQTG
ncbi:ATP-binding protein [Streptomyces sp. ME19-01-6]|uniref:ATP-binding protein n=1 Tax=Streptomyces sp. ME19-01-6 TaxID=3028686 RepID=UPI0039F59600